MNNTTNDMIYPEYSSGDARLDCVLPLRQVVLFPGTEVTLDVGRRASKAAITQVKQSGGHLLLLTQREMSVENPEKKDLYPIGTIAEVVESASGGPASGMRVLVKVLARVQLISIIQQEPFMQASWRPFLTKYHLSDEAEVIEKAYLRKLNKELSKYSRITGRLSQEQMTRFENLDGLEDRVDYLASLIISDLAFRYEMLETASLERRCELLISFLMKENELIALEADINNKLKVALDKSQKDYYLREKIKVISDELGDTQDKEADVISFRERIAERDIPEAVKARLNKEVDRLARVNTMSPDYGNIVNYLEFAVNLPWDVVKEENNDIVHAEKVLDQDHYGLQKVKDRILEFLAVRALHGDSKGSIICLVGPPGVGKTSLAHSIARATNRDYIRLSLGGIQDEAEIRGHRRTYVGAMPGRLLAGISHAGSSNPVFLLDEIDKINRDFRGDPASALLEALDPAQNNTFSDHYLDIPYDLSRVFFITTANTTQTIPGPLKDRMEIIELSSYTEHEKLEIAKKYLVKRAITEQGLTPQNISFSEGALISIIRDHTSESGVRELERKIATVCRRVARKVLAKEVSERVSITKRNIQDYLGRPKITHLLTSEKDEVGVAVGMAWTAFGGEILQIECQTMPGKGHLKLTGKLGDVMKESAELSLSVVRSLSSEIGLEAAFLDRIDIHLHVPQGAVPKDGPSAGVTLTTALASALTGKKLRKDVAMSGEITLRGRILAVGGVREKLIAAHRAGCRTALLPKANEHDLEDVPETVLQNLDVVFCEHIKDVWAYAFTNEGPHEN